MTGFEPGISGKTDTATQPLFIFRLFYRIGGLVLNLYAG